MQKLKKMKLKKSYFLLLLLGVATFACSPSKEKATEEAQKAVAEEIVIPSGEVNYSADTTNMKGYFAVNEKSDKKRPGILVIHEWWGHNAHSRERADMIADLGYVAFALDMYGEGKNTDHPDNAGMYMSAVVNNMDLAKARFESALNVLKNHPSVDPEKIGVIGFCFGGTMALNMASAGYDLDAVAAFHAGLQLPIMPDSTGIKAKILVANGADDPMVSSQHVEDFKRVMDAASADYKYVAYEGAVHAFTNKGADALGEKYGIPLAYNAKADSASWEEMKVLFREVF